MSKMLTKNQKKKFDQVISSLSDSTIIQTKELIIRELTRDPRTIRYVTHQTPEICIYAIDQGYLFFNPEHNVIHTSIHVSKYIRIVPKDSAGNMRDSLIIKQSMIEALK